MGHRLSAPTGEVRFEQREPGDTASAPDSLDLESYSPLIELSRRCPTSVTGSLTRLPHDLAINYWMREYESMWEWAGSHPKVASGLAAACIVVAAAAGWLVATDPWDSPYIALPAEYVYLDTARVDAYLGQLQNGLAKSEQQSLTHTGSANASVAAGSALSLGSSVTDTQSTERIVKPDDGDRLYKLLEDLHRQFPDRIHAIDLRTDSNASSDIENVPKSHFIELRNARLAIPEYALPVPSLSLGVQRVLQPEKPVSSTAVAAIIAAYPDEVREYLKSFGANAAFPLRIVRQGAGSDAIVVPVLLSGLLSNPSLTAGDVTILGVVVRQIPKTDSARGPYDIQDPSYFDASSAVATERALTKIPRHLAHLLRLPRTNRGITSLIDETELVEGPATIVLPIAIYV